jgi:acetyl esterase/lipase
MASAPPLIPPAHDAPLPSGFEASGGVRVLAGVPYAALPGVRPLELDLYLPPPGDSPAPVVIFLHGGGFRVGTRRSAGPAYARRSPGPFEQIASAGIAVASVDYRLSGEQQWPAQLHDVKAAVRWLRARGAEAGLDSTRIAAWGESAGGHLAAMLGLTGPDLDGRDLDGHVGVIGPASAVDAVVAWYPPSDLTALPGDAGADAADPDSREALLLGAPLSEVPELARQASPITYVRADSPPILLLHGRDDRMIPCAQSDRFAAALRRMGAPVDFETFPGADHMWLGSPEAATAALARTIEFLHRNLGG